MKEIVDTGMHLCAKNIDSNHINLVSIMTKILLAWNGRVGSLNSFHNCFKKNSLVTDTEIKIQVVVKLEELYLKYND